MYKIGTGAAGTTAGTLAVTGVQSVTLVVAAVVLLVVGLLAVRAGHLARHR